MVSNHRSSYLLAFSSSRLPWPVSRDSILACLLPSGRHTHVALSGCGWLCTPSRPYLETLVMNQKGCIAVA